MNQWLFAISSEIVMWIPFVLFFGFFGGIIFIVRHFEQRYLKKYMEWAQGLGFHSREMFQGRSLPRNLILEMSREGRTFLLDRFYVKHGKSSTTYHRLRLEGVNSPTLKFELYQQLKIHKWLERWAPFLGLVDVKTGDSVFDEDFFISSNDPEAALRLLNASLKQKFMQMKQLNFPGQFKLNQDELSYQEVEGRSDLETDEKRQRFQMAQDVLSEMAKQIAPTHSGF